MMTPRLRVFAGPNGSGKSTLAAWLSTDFAVNLYHFINADVIFAQLTRNLCTPCPFDFEADKLRSFTASSTYPTTQRELFQNGAIRVEEDYVVFSPEAINSYTAAMLADFYRAEYLSRAESFSFETVFSHPSKIGILEHAKLQGYRTYLYFVSTDAPEINLSRVQSRVSKGGHNVPEKKIVERYSRSLANGADALSFCNRAYFFDNSGTKMRLFAECHEGTWCFKSHMPQWFLRYFQKAFHTTCDL